MLELIPCDQGAPSSLGLLTMRHLGFTSMGDVFLLGGVVQWINSLLSAWLVRIFMPGSAPLVSVMKHLLESFAGFFLHSWIHGPK